MTLKVIQKRRFAALITPRVLGGNVHAPELASGDYIVNPVHDGSPNAIKMARDSYYGMAELRSETPQWWQLDIQLTYPDKDPEVPAGNSIHYSFKVLPPSRLNYLNVKRMVNRILHTLYLQLGLGLGQVFMSIIPNDKVMEHLASGRIEPLDSSGDIPMDFSQWIVNADADMLHFVPPESIPHWDAPVY